MGEAGTRPTQGVQGYTVVHIQCGGGDITPWAGETRPASEG